MPLTSETSDGKTFDISESNSVEVSDELANLTARRASVLTQPTAAHTDLPAQADFTTELCAAGVQCKHSQIEKHCWQADGKQSESKTWSQSSCCDSTAPPVLSRQRSVAYYDISQLPECVVNEIVNENTAKAANQAIAYAMHKMFRHVDIENKGSITRERFLTFLGELGLASISGNQLLSLLGFNDMPSIAFHDFVHGVVSLMERSSVANAATEVFLGGACGDTTWRRDIAIPIFNQHHISFYDPHVKDWNPHLVVLENLMKACSSILLFVIDSSTRSLASMVEAAQYISERRNVVLVINNVNAGTEIRGERIQPEEEKDINRARVYLANAAELHNVPIFDNIAAACKAIVDLAQTSRSQHESQPNTFTHPLGLSECGDSSHAASCSVSSSTSIPVSPSAPPVAPPHSGSIDVTLGRAARSNFRRIHSCQLCTNLPPPAFFGLNDFS